MKKLWQYGCSISLGEEATRPYGLLAAEHYGNPKYWWVIAWYNQRPTENMLNLGNTIIIPKPLEVVLESLRYY